MREVAARRCPPPALTLSVGPAPRDCYSPPALALSSVEELTILDSERGVQYVSSTTTHDLAIDDPEIISRLESGELSRREILLPSGEPRIEVVLPVRESSPEGDRRLGSHRSEDESGW